MYRQTKILLILSGIVLSALVIHASRILIYTDLTITPAIIKNDNNIPTYLISYASGPEIFFRNQNALSWSAINKGIDIIVNYKSRDLAPSFINKNKTILQQSKGAGLWLWKPYVILKTMQEAPINAVIIYADTGFVFKDNLVPLIKLAQQHDVILSHYDEVALYGTLGKVTRRKILQTLNLDTPKARQAPHIWAAFMVLRNTKKAQAFIQEWLQLCENKALLLDNPSSLSEYPEFKIHHFDQTLLSVLAYQKQQQVFLMPVTQLEEKYITWHHRHPGAEQHSLVADIFKNNLRKSDKLLSKYLPLWLKNILWR